VVTLSRYLKEFLLAHRFYALNATPGTLSYPYYKSYSIKGKLEAL
jgi:hypothetical protein